MSRLFDDRIDAGRRLAAALSAYKGRNPLVLAIPRGAVAMGAEIARLLEGELDVVLVKKLHAPRSPEFAVGAVDESGWTYVAPYAREAGADERYLAREKDDELALLKRRRTLARAPRVHQHGRDARVRRGRAALAAHCAERLAACKRPSRIEFRDALPKSPLGKVLRRELKTSA